ncbi:mechanosensitive ion channel family protein [Kiloniella sp. b19]|uniref:mechanosensitive ion channel family protein n=1 Tax=Kiloniella sp. GXU_MW_B19 TaxID=3141326 RepID=UPI0031DCEA84
MESLQQYWNLVLDVWNTGAFGIDIGRLGIALLVFMVILMIRRAFARIVIRRLHSITKRTRTTLDDEALNALDGPLRMVPITLGVFFLLEYLKLSGDAETFGENLLRSLLAYTLFFALFKLVSPMATLLNRLEELLSSIMIEWLVKAAKLLIFMLGSAAILEIWGINVGAIIAGFGLFGVAVALGAQDLFKNLIAGILIIAEKRYSLGDWIMIDGLVEGTVEDIGFRSTRIRRFDKAPVYVPNAKLSDSAVINFSKMTNRRIYWMIGVEYGTTSAQLQQIVHEIRDYIEGSSDYETDPAVTTTLINIDSFNSSSIDIMVYCFTKTTNWGRWMEIKQDLALKLKEIVEGAGTGFAFPTSTLHVASLPPQQIAIGKQVGAPEVPDFLISDGD